EQLCDGRAESLHELRSLIAARKLPQPSYVLPDGTGMFPADYFRLVDEAGSVDGLREHFAARHRAAHGKDVDQDWEMYLDGTWGICLRDVTLTGHETLPASALAAHAGIAPSTASEHLRKLVAGGFLASRKNGRHRYFTLADPAVAAAIEALACVAPQPPVRSLREATKS